MCLLDRSVCIKTKTCRGCGVEKLVIDFNRAGGLGKYQSRCKPCQLAQIEQWKKNNPTRTMVHRARKRAKKSGIICTLKIGDVVIPNSCPVCKKPMEAGTRDGRDSSPSLDRIIPVLGYVAENCIVICVACNRIKNDATPEQLYAIADYVYRLRKVRGLC